MRQKGSNAARERKSEAAALLIRRYVETEESGKLEGSDARLCSYLDDLCARPEAHNAYELLGAARFLRLLAAGELDAAKLRRVLLLGEGVWRANGGRLEYVSGGLKQPGAAGETVYRWEPFQVFVLASIFGLKAWRSTGDAAGGRPLLPTERERAGQIEDFRRVCTDFTFYAPRKTNKTGLAAFVQTVFFLLEDINAEIYCCANAADQARILYDRTRGFLRQLDSGRRIRQTATVCDWRPAFRAVRQSVLRPLTAGGKTKDGMFAQLCCADEYGSAPWVKGRSDMKSLVDVIQSSMGPRREPLTLTTTTAGTISAGPFVDKLDGLHRMLWDELEAAPGLKAGDGTLCLLLEPDEWERGEDVLLTDRSVRAKVNPMLGKIVQHTFYDDWAARVRLDPGNLSEYVTKLFNVYRPASQTEWITAEDVRARQVGRRVDECRAADGWLTFCGMDFSLGDDLHAISYLSFNTRTREFFADCDGWLTEAAIERSALREVYQRWVREGWLGVSPGETLDPDLPIGRIAELLERKEVNFASFLYDPYKAKQPINALCAYLHDRLLAMGGAVPDLSRIVMPCRQNYATFNPLVMELDALVKAASPAIRFSRSPLWEWEAGNMVLDTSTDGMENRKPRKRNAGAKIDNWICLLEALRGFDIADGQVYSET